MLQRVAPVNPRAPTAIAAISMIIILLALSGSLIQAREADAMMKAIADFALAFPVTPPARDAGGDAASPPPIPLKAHAPEQLIAAAAGHRAEKPSPIIVVGGTRVDKPPAAERLSGIMMLDPREVFWKAEPWSRLNGLTAVTHRGNYTFLGNGTVVYRFREYGGYMHEMTIYYGLEPEAEPVSIRFTRLEDAAVEYELTRNDGASLQVSWFFTMPAPKTRIIAKNPPSDYRIYAVVRSANGIYSGGDGARAVIEFETESAPQVYSMMDEGVAEVKALSRNAVKIMFARNKPIIDPMLYVVAPSTVTVDWGIAGDRTLLTITDNLPAGNKIVLFALGWDSATDVGAKGYLKIVTGSTVLVQEGITHYLNIGGMRAKHVMLFAYHSNAPANAQYTFILTVTAGVLYTPASTLHVQGMVILLAEPAFFTTGINTNIAAGATVTLATVNTNFPAGSKVAVLAYVQMGVTSTTTGHRVYAAGNIRILKGSTIVSSNQFQVSTYQAIEPAHVSLSYLDASSDANPSYSIQVYNSLSETSQAWGEIIAFRVGDSAFLDTGSVALTSGSQVTVGNLTTSLSGEVGVIALAAAENTGSSDVTAFNAGDVVLQLNNQATGQVANQRGWYIYQTTYNGRSGVYALFRVDVGVSNPSYQVKMTARASGINGEAKILAFSFVCRVTVRYVVAEGGRAPEGAIILRYYYSGSLMRLALSSSYQTVLVDHNSMINADFISSGSNQYERWAYAGGRNFTMTIISNVTLDLLYYNQLSVTLIPVTSKPYTSKTSPENYARVNVTAFGAVFTLNVWENDTLVSAWVDRGGNVAWSMTTSGSTSTRRWATPGAVTLEGVSSPGVSTAIYYEQVRVTWRLVKNRMNITSIGPDNYFNASGKQFNGTLTLTGLYPGRDVSDWIDVYSIISVSSVSSGSRPDHWWALHPAGSSYNVSSPGTYVFKYEEWVLARIDVLDADGDHSLSGAVSRLAMRNANGSAFYAKLGDVLQLPYNMCNYALEAMWRGIWSRLNPPSPCFAPKSPLESFNFTHPNIWVLGDSGVEWYLDSDAGSRVFTWLYGKNSGTLIVIQDKNKGDSSYFYYGGYGRTPQYVYVEGSLVEN
ncbi:MAG: hypothetical protein QW692_04050, partial [Nitrososphaerota archaeon]